MLRARRSAAGILCLVLAFALSPVSAAAIDDPRPTSQPAADSQPLCGRLEHIGELRVLSLWGTPSERGFAHGYLLADDIRTLLVEYLADERLSGGPKIYNAVTLVAVRPPFIKHDPRIVDEVEGMLRGLTARLGRDGVYIDSLKRAMEVRDLHAINSAADSPIGCSSFAAWGNMTKDGATLAGRNLDWFYSKLLSDHQLVIVQAPDESVHRLGWVGVTWPGAIGCYTAMNAEGVTLAIHDVDGRALAAPMGVTPRVLALRDAIELARAPTAFTDMARTLCSHKVSVGTNAAVNAPARATGGPCAAVLEYDGLADAERRITVRRPRVENAWLVCTNHFRCRAAAEAQQLRDTSTGQCGRYDRALEYLADAASQHRTLDVSDAAQILSRVATRSATSGGIFTFQSVIFEPDARRLHVGLSQGETSAADRPRTLLDVTELLARAGPGPR